MANRREEIAKIGKHGVARREKREWESEWESVGSNLFLRKSENMSCPCWEQPRAPSRHAKRRSMNTRHFESFMHLQVVLARLYATHVAACALAMGMMTSQATPFVLSRKVSTPFQPYNLPTTVQSAKYPRNIDRNRQKNSTVQLSSGSAIVRSVETR